MGGPARRHWLVAERRLASTGSRGSVPALRCKYLPASTRWGSDETVGRALEIEGLSTAARSVQILLQHCPGPRR